MLRGGWNTSARFRRTMHGECFLCQAVNAPPAEQRAASCALDHASIASSCINKFPYTNGHLLIAPKATSPSWKQLSDAECSTCRGRRPKR